MKRNLISLLVLGLVVLWGAAATVSQAAPLLQATPTDQAGWQAGTLVRVKPSVPFSWLRKAPSSSSAVLDTAPAGDYLVIYATPPVWDGVQWWWAVRRGNVIGYVEQNSLEEVLLVPTVPGEAVSPTPTVPPASPTPLPASETPGVTTTQANWNIRTMLRVKASKPFSWLRSAPSSGATPVDYAKSLESLFVISDTPQWDGVQWWWLVRRGTGSIIGYVEQDSLEPINAPTPTASPTPVSATPSGSAQPPAPAAWRLGSLHSVKLTVRFAWVRVAASSNAGAQVAIYPGWLVIIRDATPYWDGVQWWWYVSTAASNVRGWVEQNSLD
jgi:hypothetical protein